MEEQEKKEGERLRRKIAATILTGLYDQTPERLAKMQSLLTAQDVKIKNEQYESLIDMMAKGQVGRNQGRELIAMIQKPVDQYGVSEIFARINTAPPERGGATKVTRMKRILGNFSDTGFDRYYDTNASSVATFFTHFPDAMSFDEEADRFLRSVNNPQNPPEVVAEYYEAMTDFKNVMFGSEQRYLDQYKVMEQQATRRREEFEAQKARLVSTSSARQVSKVALKKLDGAKLRDEDVAEVREESEDVYTSLPEVGVFGVFDGAGNTGDGQTAAIAAKHAFEKQNPGKSHSAAELAQMMELMNEMVLKTGGMSTAVVVKVNRAEDDASNPSSTPDGTPPANDPNTAPSETTAPKEYLSFASVGDSRLYIVHKNGTVDLLTKDEGEGNRVWNILGIEKNERAAVRGHLNLPIDGPTCLQAQDIWLEEGDRIVLCSDGVTGDSGSDILSNEEIAKLVSTRTTEQAVEALIRAAKKIDDRTAIVFDA